MTSALHSIGIPAAVPRSEAVPLLIVGNHLSATGANPGVCEDLADRLRLARWPTMTTSHRRVRLSRLVDMLQTCWSKRRRYAVAQVDVFSGSAFCWAEAVCWMLRRAGRPYVLTLHGGNLPGFSLRWPNRVRRLLGSAQAVTAPSPYLGMAMRRFRGDLQVVPNALDAGAYPFVHRRRARPLLVWLRAFHRIYNPMLGPQVLAILAAQLPGVHLTMYGPDKDRSLERTRRAARRLGVHRQLDLPGSVPKQTVSQRLNEADIFLNTSRVDNTPVSVLEAMACGLCIVSTDVGGIRTLLDDERDALLVPPDDPAAMAQAILRVIREPGLAARLSLNARRKAESFDWSHILPRWKVLLAAAARRQLP